MTPTRCQLLYKHCPPENNGAGRLHSSPRNHFRTPGSRRGPLLPLSNGPVLECMNRGPGGGEFMYTLKKPVHSLAVLAVLELMSLWR